MGAGSRPDKGLKTGKLKFTLHGEKLHGSWALVRMGGRAGDGGKNWLLIKHRDDEAKPAAKFDVLKREPKSVALRPRDGPNRRRCRRRVVEQRQSGTQSQNESSRAKKSRRKTATTKTHIQKRSQTADRRSRQRDLAKVTGARRGKPPRRLQAAAGHARQPRSRRRRLAARAEVRRLPHPGVHRRRQEDPPRHPQRQRLDARFHVVADALAELPIKNAILDGEVVSLDADGISNFQQLQNSLKTRRRPIRSSYYVFDVPYLNGYDLTDTPLDRAQRSARPRCCSSANPDNDGSMRYSDHIQGQGESVLQQACRSAMEGIIAKRADSTYQQFRSPSWLKVKCLKQQEFVIGGYTKPEGSRVGFGALLLGYYDDGELKYAGRVGTGFTTQSLQANRGRTEEAPRRQAAVRESADRQRAPRRHLGEARAGRRSRVHRMDRRRPAAAPVVPRPARRQAREGGHPRNAEVARETRE